MSILLLSDLKRSTRTIIRGKSKTPKTLPALIIRGKKIVQLSKKRPSALIRGRTKVEKLRYTLSHFRNDKLLFCDIISSAEQLFHLCVVFIRAFISFYLVQANFYGRRIIELFLQILLNVMPQKRN